MFDFVYECRCSTFRCICVYRIPSLAGYHKVPVGAVVRESPHEDDMDCSAFCKCISIFVLIFTFPISLCFALHVRNEGSYSAWVFVTNKVLSNEFMTTNACLLLNAIPIQYSFIEQVL